MKYTDISQVLGFKFKHRSAKQVYSLSFIDAKHSNVCWDTCTSSYHNSQILDYFNEGIWIIVDYGTQTQEPQYEIY